MSNDDEMALLTDLARLLRKHGRGAFADLAKTLDDPDFTHSLSSLLTKVASSAPEKRPPTKSRQERDQESLLGVSLRLQDANTEVELVLRPIVEAVSRGEDKPRLKDLRAFADRNGLLVSSSSSRRGATAQLINLLLDLPDAELEGLLADMKSLGGPDDRSLEGWNRIIERSRADLTD